MPKSNQLRVRLEDGQRERLLEIASARGKGERLSDMVRQAISEFISPEPLDLRGSHYVNVTSDASGRSSSWPRNSTVVRAKYVEACVEGIQDILERKRTPLIIYEVHLRRKYHKKSPVKQSSTR